MTKVFKIMHKTITPSGKETEAVYDMFGNLETAEARLDKIAKAEEKNGVKLTAKRGNFIQTDTICKSQYYIKETIES